MNTATTSTSLTRIDDYTFIAAGSPEWEYAWGELRKAFGTGADNAEHDPRSGESWQYMGTGKDAAGYWAHNFRHRLHPRTGKRETFRISATADFYAENGLTDPRDIRTPGYAGPAPDGMDYSAWLAMNNID